MWRQKKNVTFGVYLFSSVMLMFSCVRKLSKDVWCVAAATWKLFWKENLKVAFLFWHHDPTSPSYPLCAVFDPTRSEIWYFYMAKTRWRKNDILMFLSGSHVVQSLDSLLPPPIGTGTQREKRCWTLSLSSPAGFRPYIGRGKERVQGLD